MLKKIAFLLLPIVLFLSCGKDTGPSVNLLFLPIEFEIPAGTNPFQTYHFYIKNVPTQFAATLAASGFKVSDIKRIEGARAQFDADFADSEYKYFKSVSVRVYEEPNQIGFLEAFYQEPISISQGNFLPLNPSLANLDEYLKSESISFDIAIEPHSVTPESIPTRLTMVMRIKF
jgi:hypothetical protein